MQVNLSDVTDLIKCHINRYFGQDANESMEADEAKELALRRLLIDVEKLEFHQPST